ncbi:16S rRNA (guanine(527)-N(7))-methyltransferase RsmG [bacterium]|nr:16S rRNA (guanine(527)-N(7))-methyltransferase RsmG [bacterium]
MQTDIDKIDEYFKSLPEEQRNQFKKYFEALVYFNSKVNLVSSSTISIAAKQHFSDCVQGIQLIEKSDKLSGTVYDFGSGNGFPGIILAIMREDLALCLVERDVRKAEFLKHVVAELKLTNVVVFPKSLEKLDKRSVTHGITRALGSISNLLIQMNSLFATGGNLFHFKAESWSSEIASCPTQVFANWDIQSLGQYTLPETTVERSIIRTVKL